ncbi:hypothetical protein DXG01_008422 [Tephrocybe rancida]|nr:hypothetical protein DXG01_008422 [Tephrocybe rancida]
MPGKHVHFDKTSTPQQPNYSISPPPFNQSGSPHAYSPLPLVETYIHPALRTAQGSSTVYDLRLPPDNAIVQYQVAEEAATNPPLPHMVITCPALGPGWAVKVEASQVRSGVTVLDVLSNVYQALRVSVSGAEYERHSQDNKRRVSSAFQHRYQNIRANQGESIEVEKARALEQSKGLKRVDFLGEMFMLGGLRHTHKGPEVWELCVRP